MSTNAPSSSPDSSSLDEEFQRLLAECLARIERDGSGALDAFRAEHPAFASRLGRQLDWLVEHLAHRKEGLPDTIGPYRVVQRLGAGGMGEVYLGEQTVPFRRAVAVKVVRLDKSTEPRLQRFAAEIQALASLNHNGIAKVFEAGSDGGRPYFAMEYVPGKPITNFCADERLALDERLRLFVDVCHAVEHAHRQGIIHRDLKPSNILVYGPRTEPVAKIIDFGLAKVIDPERAREQRLTQTASLVGTPDYMSPEQVDDSGRLIVDTRADVYALGVVLYELLTGALPLSLWQLGAQNVHAMIRTIREREPSSPSMRVKESASEDDTPSSRLGLLPPRKLSRVLAGDLDSIVMKALAKNAERRYGGVAQLADDVLRYLSNEPVSARPQTRGYVLSKFVRRNRTAVGFATSMLVLAFASLVTVNVYALENQGNLERGNLFGLVQYLGDLRSRELLHPPAARPEQLGELREWQREFDTILAQRDRMRSFLAKPAAKGDSANPDDWASGSNAQRVLCERLESALRAIDVMSAPGALVDKMNRRVEWAKQVVARTVDEHRSEWERVRREVRADTRFRGLDLKPQVGLIPLGRHEGTGLQEFALPLPRSEMPRRVDGQWRVGAGTCLVFVLLPGGDVHIGCQNEYRDQFRYDEKKEDFEADVRPVHLDPFFASKYEFTNWQWQLVDPENEPLDPANVHHAPDQPVSSLTGDQMLHALRAWGMRLPTADEWEYLARGGSDHPYWCGRTEASLQGNENLYDQRLLGEPNAQGEGEAVPWSDDFVVAAPVGSFPGNGFLLHDVLGNVCEVAVTRQAETIGPWTAEDMVLELRGSSWHLGARDARATSTAAWDPLGSRPSIGFRPVISVQR